MRSKPIIGSAPTVSITSGDIVDGTITGDDIATATVPLTDLATIPDQRLVGNNSGAAASPSSLTAAQAKALLAIDGTDVADIMTVYNVRDYGATGDGVTDDHAAITAAITASTTGSTIWFPKGTYLTLSTIEYVGDRQYVGEGYRNTVIKMAAGANLNAVMAPTRWNNTGNASSVTPVAMRGLGINGNQVNQASGDGHGLVVQSYFSVFEDCQFSNGRGDGCRQTSVNQAGAVTISNTMVETRYVRCAFRDNLGRGLAIIDASANKLTDGWVTDCVAEGNSTEQIFIGAGAGWEISGCHVYGVQTTGIKIVKAFQTKVLGNYIEAWGRTSTVGTYYAIDLASSFVADNGAPSIIANNVARFSTGAAATSTIRAIGVTAATGATGHVIVANNTCYGLSWNSVSRGIHLSTQSGTATLKAVVSGNQMVGWDTPYFVPAGSGTLEVTGDAFRTDMLTTATAGFHRLPATAGTPAGTPADLTRGTPTIWDSTNNLLYIYSGGAWRLVGPDNTTLVKLTGDQTVAGNKTFSGSSVFTGSASFTSVLTASTATKNSAYPITTADNTIPIDSTGGVITTTLPTAVGIAGQEFTVKDVGGAADTNAITIATTSAQTIDGLTTKTLAVPYGSVTVKSDGANWMIVRAYTPRWNTLMLRSQGSLTSTPPSSATRFLGNTNQSYGAAVDLRLFRQVRLTARCTSAGTAGSRIRVRYTTTFDATAANQVVLGASSAEVECTMTTGDNRSAWITIASAAQAGGIWLGVMEANGDGVTSVTVSYVMLELRG